MVVPVARLSADGLSAGSVSLGMSPAVFSLMPTTIGGRAGGCPTGGWTPGDGLLNAYRRAGSTGSAGTRRTARAIA